MAKVKQQELDGAGNLVDKPAKAPKEPKAKKAPKVKVKTVRKFIFAKEPAEGVRLAPQLALIVKHVKAAGESGIAVDDLIKVLDADEAFQTRQPVARIIAYYQPTLTVNEIIKIVKEEQEVAAAEQGELAVETAQAEETAAE